MLSVNRDTIGKEHHSWRTTLAVIALAQFLSGIGFSFVFPFLPFYLGDLGLKTQKEVLLWFGYTSIVFGITMAVFAPIWGILADRWGRKLMVIRSMFSGAVILGLMGLATSPWHILFLRILQGMTTGTVTAAVTLVSSITPAKNLGLSLGIVQTGLLVGNAVGPLLGGILADHFGYRIPCGLAFIVLSTGALLVIFFATEKFTPPEDPKLNGFKTMNGIIKTEGFKVILAIFFFIYVISTMVAPILPLFIKDLSNNSSNVATLTGLFIAVAGLLSGITAAYAGRLGDRFGYTRVLVISLVLSGLFSIPQALANNLWILFIERCLLGIAVGGIIPTVNALVSNTISRDNVGSAYGLTSSVTCLGIGVGPFIGGGLAAAFGLRWPFVIMGVVAIVIALLVHKMATFRNSR
ncbi:MAG: MFS transporter [Candidatus Latescibacterota bacterium]